MNNESVQNVILVTVLLCLVCSVMVSGSAVLLRPHQEANRIADMRRNILEVAGIYDPDMSVERMFDMIEPRVLNLRAARFSDVSADEVDLSVGDTLLPTEDIARIGSLERLTRVFLVRRDGRLDQLILPVRGYGLWSTLQGFLSVDADGRTIRGLQFYDHKETPGLGGEVDNPKWRALWPGTRIYDDSGKVLVRVGMGKIDEGAREAEYQVDGLSGATLTGRGVTNMLRFWLGEKAYRPFLDKVAREGLQ